jgi:hypothetical protein
MTVTRLLSLPLLALAPLMLAACDDAATIDGAAASGEALPAIAAPAGTKWADTVTVTPEGGYQIGNPEAPIKLVEYASHTCGACANFAKTGKFEWKGFVNMMLEELLRAQIQSIFAQMLGGMQGMMGGRNGGGGGSGGGGSSIIGSLLGGIGSLFGGGGSRQQPARPTQGGGSSGGGIFSTIGNIFSGAKDLFSGFFANGGTIPQGRFGIVGEAGPEFVGGPASVTPRSGTNVTYNINAVDARSFQQLLAQDPSFIFALTEQGRRGYAGAR